MFQCFLRKWRTYPLVVFQRLLKRRVRLPSPSYTILKEISWVGFFYYGKDCTDRRFSASLDEHAFRRIPEVGAAPDMISDDLPSNPDYLDQSFSATAGLREITDDDLDDFGVEDNNPTTMEQPGVVSKHGGETIRMLQPTLHTVEHHFDALPPDANDEGLQ